MADMVSGGIRDTKRQSVARVSKLARIQKISYGIIYDVIWYNTRYYGTIIRRLPGASLGGRGVGRWAVGMLVGRIFLSGTREKIGAMAKNAVKFEPLNPFVTLPLTGVRVVYEPSVYGGDGTETRKNIVLEVSAEALDTIRGHDASIDASRLCSCIKDDALKCKINMDKVRIFDQGNVPIAPPETWRDLRVNAVVLLKGRWVTKTQTGLSLEVVDVQLTPHAPPKSPFAQWPTTGDPPEVVRAY